MNRNGKVTSSQTKTDSPKRSTSKPKKGYFATVPPQEILPIIDNSFQSSVKGIFVIGDVTGVPLVKIAANHGAEVIERMERKKAFDRNGQDNGQLDVLIVGGGNSAIEAALMLIDNNRVTLSYRRDDFFRLKLDNRQMLDQAIAEGRLTVMFESNVQAIRDDQVDIEVPGEMQTLPNDYVLVLIGTLPPVDLLLDTGMELDGVWTKKRVIYCTIGILVGYLVYFLSKNFSLLPQAAGSAELVGCNLCEAVNSGYSEEEIF